MLPFAPQEELGGSRLPLQVSDPLIPGGCVPSCAGIGCSHYLKVAYALALNAFPPWGVWVWSLCLGASLFSVTVNFLPK